MQKLFRKLLDAYPILTIISIWVAICVINYSPGTYLTGWDNLHPEFNFKVNIVRSIFSTWQEYQGLGLLAGMAHASDLPRQIMLWIFSLVVPDNLLRYLYHFSMLLAGALGIYFLLAKKILSHHPVTMQKLGGLFGAIFALVNLGSIQYFYVPFEPYSTFWGLLPWEIFVLFSFLEKPTRKNLLMLMVVNILAIPQAYVQTIFLVYLICVGLILGIFTLSKFSWSRIAQSIKVAFVIGIINAFWLLPNLFFTVSDLSVTQNAMQNRMATEKFFQMNKNRGTIADFALMKEFYYDFLDYSQETESFYYLLEPWRAHYETIPVQIVGYLFFAVILIGLVSKNPYRRYFVGLFILSSLVFLSNTVVFSSLNDLFRSLPVVNQILRNPFTKFVVPTVFIFSLCFSLGMVQLMLWLHDRRWVKYAAVTMTLVGLLLISYPAFKGYYIAPQMRVAIPDEYFQVFDYFDTQDKNARIANLPQGNYWGWYYYRWGARGSGFLWYGIEQPIMDRAFDVWSNELEDYYWQLSHALKKKDMELFNQVLEKYQISYLLFDNNILFSDNINAPRASLNQEGLLVDNPKIEKVKTFGKVSIYKVKLNHPVKNNVSLAGNLPGVKSQERFSHFDQAFARLGDYTDKQGQVAFPYGSLFTNRFTAESPVKIHEASDSYALSTNLTKGNYTLQIPDLFKTEKIIPTRVWARIERNMLTVRFVFPSPEISVNNTQILYQEHSQEIAVPLTAGEITSPPILSLNNTDYLQLPELSSNFAYVGSTYFLNVTNGNSYRLFSTADVSPVALATEKFENAHICGVSRDNTSLDTKSSADTLTISAKNTAVCAVYQGELAVPEKTLIKTEFRYISSSDEFPQYCLFSQNTNSCLNKKDTIKVGFSPKENAFEDYFESNDTLNDTLYFQSILDASGDEDSDTQKQITYRDIAITSYPYITGGVVEFDSAPNTERSLALPLDKDSTLTVTIPKIESSYGRTDALSNNIYKTSPLNYDTLLPGGFSLTQNDDRSLSLQAQNASSYLLFRANELNSGYGYLASITSKNDSGFPLIVNIFSNTDYRNYMYSYTNGKKAKTTEHFLLPPIYEFDQGVDILLGSTSYNNHETKNTVYDFSISPLPYTFLSGISLNTESLATGTFSAAQSTKNSLTQYTVTADPGFDTIILSQSFHPGWKAYILPKDASLFTRLLSPLFAESQPHFTVNNWGNGWESPQDGSTVILVFLPQYLQYAGFLLLLSLPFFFINRK